MGYASAQYQQAHNDLKRARGKASEYLCSCGKPAQDWAYLYTGEPLRSPDDSRPYSTNPDDYAPMCRKCHIRFDTENDPLYAERRRAGIGRGRMLALEKVAEMRRSDPEFVEKQNETLRANTAVRVQCAECGMISTRPGMGNHHKSSGHIGRKELA